MNIDRKIIHIDMDAFFAAIEQRDHPEYRGKPVIVGGSPDRRGVVSTASYEARVFGVRSAMPSVTAAKLCPHGIWLHPDGERYRDVSRQIRAIFRRCTELVEPLSIDEAFLDVTETVRERRVTAVRLARNLQREIYAETRLTGSAGVSYNKFLAKIASDLKKPSGLSVITPEMAPEFLAALPIEKFYGIGPATAARFRKMGIRSGRELKMLDLRNLQINFGKTGEFFYQIVRGIDERPVEPVSERKSLGREITFPEDISRPEEFAHALAEIASDVAFELASRRLRGRTVTLKVRYENFQTVTRGQSFPESKGEAAELLAIGSGLLTRTEAGRRAVRLLGLTASGLVDADAPPEPRQLELVFPEPE